MKIYIIGIGPGNLNQITENALEAINSSDVIVGYTKYIQLIENLIKEKEVFTSGMRQEKERCRKAVELALEGRTVAVVSSGDSGIYGMAGLVYELAEKYPYIQMEVIPGITAAVSAAAVLGAPIMHDFAVISLSDLLTPWEKIEEWVIMAS